MSIDETAAAAELESVPQLPSTDDNTTLALAAGVVATLVAGGLWALLVRLTGYEIGYAAWGVGLLVGFAMAWTTRNRTRQLAIAAAAFAVLGLAVGKLFIMLGSTGTLARELSADDEFIAGAMAWHMYDERQLDAATLDELDATIAAGDTISDAAWLSMLQQAEPGMAALSAEERDAIARNAARAALQGPGPVNGLLGQLSGFDLLWILLAVGTAYRMMLPAPEEEPAELQQV